MRRLLALSAAVAAFAPAALSDAAVTVSVKDNFFSPKSVTVSKGSSVKWVWKGKAKHNVTASGFGSKTQRSGTFSHRFNKTTSVFCTIHGGMTMKVKVQ